MIDWDYSIESDGCGKAKMRDKTGNIIPMRASNIKGKKIRVWNSIRADEVIKKGGTPVYYNGISPYLQNMEDLKNEY